jgi:hypothetical protein
MVEVARLLLRDVSWTAGGGTQAIGYDTQFKVLYTILGSHKLHILVSVRRLLRLHLLHTGPEEDQPQVGSDLHAALIHGTPRVVCTGLTPYR